MTETISSVGNYRIESEKTDWCAPLWADGIIALALISIVGVMIYIFATFNDQINNDRTCILFLAAATGILIYSVVVIAIATAIYSLTGGCGTTLNLRRDCDQVVIDSAVVVFSKDKDQDLFAIRMIVERFTDTANTETKRTNDRLEQERAGKRACCTMYKDRLESVKKE
jgi:hypothetical protein